MPMLEQYEFLFKESPEMRRVLALIYTDILTFHKKAIRSVTGRGKALPQFSNIEYCLSRITYSLATGIPFNMERF